MRLRSRTPRSCKNVSRMATVQFGVYEFDLDTRELRRAGSLVHLQAQPTQVLHLFLTRPGQLVTREELRNLLWGTETFVDFDRSLNFCISQVRTALKDDAANPHFIRTVPKQGYQFICPIRSLESAVPAFDKELPPQTSKYRGARYAIAAIVLAALGIGAIFLSGSRHRADLKVAVFHFDNETGEPGFDQMAGSLTDNLVVDLTSAGQGQFQVIGNAAALRGPREQRDLNAIGASLKASYVILGQVQRQGTGVRVLAHLIRLPEQTHISVVRMDAASIPASELPAKAAQQISSEFSQRLSSARP